MLPEFPAVSVIIPCRNEAAHIEACVDSILQGDYPRERLELIVADGMSDDGTRDILARLARSDSRLRLVDNRRGTTPAGLNSAIAVARGEIIVRMDAHAKVSSSYVGECVRRLRTSGADNVGGVMHTMPRGTGLSARAIAAAISHLFGVGNSRFRVHVAAPMEVDTVFGGCYRREVFERVGLFNERLARGQDMEFNLRLRRHGGRILLDPAIESWYYARSDWSSFIGHNWSNGVWALLPFAWSVGAPVGARHLVPLAFALLLTLLAALAPWQPLARGGLLATGGLYASGALAASLHAAAARRDPALAIALPFAFAALHLPYGFGSLWGLCRLIAIKAADGSLAGRAFDLFASAAGLAVLSPLFCLVALAVRSDGGPAFYRGERIARGGVSFRMLKFRTMVPDAEQRGGSSTAEGDPRVSRIGRIIRRWKLDELPQLWNVLLGDMSLVGPRPQVRHDVDKYTEEERFILSIRPGITDWSSIRFRNEGELLKGHADPDQAYIDLIRPEKLRLQLYYVRNRTFWMDMRILWATFLALLGREVQTP